VALFITNFAEKHGLPSPGRNFLKGQPPLIHLSSHLTYRAIWKSYKAAVDPDLEVSEATFMRLWKKYCSNIQFLTPRSDLCMVCKEMRFNIDRMKQESKRDFVQEWADHRAAADKERGVYKESIIAAKKELENVGGVEALNIPGVANSVDMKMHISWDFAQSVSYPFSSQQVVNANVNCFCELLYFFWMLTLKLKYFSKF
jgi:hypothetical protein